MGLEVLIPRNIVLLNHQWLASELKALGHNVITAGWREQPLDVKFPWRCSVSEFLEMLPEGYSPDCFIYFDDSSLPCFVDFENLTCPKVFFSVDTHHHLEWHKEFAKLFDITLVAQKDFIKFLEPDLGDRARWFPLWATMDFMPQEEKTIDVCFRGTIDEGLHPGRLKFLQGIAEHVNLDYSMGCYSDQYTKSKIVINEAVRGDVNFRVFEGMMCGALMITPRLGNGLFELFEEGKNIVTFEDRNIDDAVNKIEYYLNNDEERVRIAEAGRKLVLEKYCSNAVAVKMGQMVEDAMRVHLNIIPDLPSVSLHASVMRYFWLFVKKYNYQNMFPHLVRTIDYLDRSFQAKLVEFNEDDPTTEVSIIMLDSLMVDLLDVPSYQMWLTSMADASDGRIPLINHLVLAFSDRYRAENEEGDNLRAVFTQNRERFIGSLSEFVTKV